jgi:hypothetical protein
MYIESIIQYLSGHIRDICGTKVIISICCVSLEKSNK